MDDKTGGSVARERLIVGAIVAVLAALAGGLHFMPFDNYSYLADAFLHGRLWIADAPEYLSYVMFDGHEYVVEPPLPAILMMPLALFFHENANQTILSVILLGVGSAACWTMLRRIPLGIADSVLLLAVMLFSTSYFFGGMRGDVWQLANVSAVTFTFLLINEVRGRNRPWLVALLALAGGFSRYTLLPLVIVYGIAGGYRFGWNYARTYADVAGAGLAAFALYNVGRWKTVVDQGYALYQVKTHYTAPMFALDNVPRQLWQMLIAPPLVQSSFPWIVPDQYGTGLAFTGIVFLIALLAPPSRTVLFLWIAIAVTVVPNLLYYDVGDVQFGFRHLLDFAPFLLVLAALALRAHRLFLAHIVGYVNVAVGVVWMFAYRALYMQ